MIIGVAAAICGDKNIDNVDDDDYYNQFVFFCDYDYDYDYYYECCYCCYL